MKKFTLVVVWYTGEKEEHEYNTHEQAERAEKGYKTAFGSQVWTCIR